MGCVALCNTDDEEIGANFEKILFWKKSRFHIKLILHCCVENENEIHCKTKKKRKDKEKGKDKDKSNDKEKIKEDFFC